MYPASFEQFVPGSLEDALRPMGIKVRQVPFSPSYIWSLSEQTKS